MSTVVWSVAITGASTVGGVLVGQIFASKNLQRQLDHDSDRQQRTFEHERLGRTREDRVNAYQNVVSSAISTLGSVRSAEREAVRCNTWDDEQSRVSCIEQAHATAVRQASQFQSLLPTWFIHLSPEANQLLDTIALRLVDFATSIDGDDRTHAHDTLALQCRDLQEIARTDLLRG